MISTIFFGVGGGGGLGRYILNFNVTLLSKVQLQVQLLLTSRERRKKSVRGILYLSN